MNAKDTVKKGYDCFSKGDMETFFNEVIHDDCVWTHWNVYKICRMYPRSEI